VLYMTTTAAPSVNLPRPRKVRAGWYEINAVGQTFTLAQATARHESLYPWHVANEEGDLVAQGTTLADAATELARYLAKSIR
jgi:hypothetical protein